MRPEEKFLEDLIAHNKTPSVQYITFNKDRITDEFRKGYADLKGKSQTDRNTVFHIFSITKTFTALAIMQLAERGFVELNKPVSDYLQDSPLVNTVTIKHLLSHTSGLGNPLPINWIHLEKEHKLFNRNEFFKPLLLKSINKGRIPGKKFSYSNLGYVILGQLIEAVSRTSYESYVTRNILNKVISQNDVLTFETTGLSATGYHKLNNLSMMLLRLMLDTSKYMDSAFGKWKPFRTVYINGTPYGGLFANTGGMVRYGQELLKDKSSLLSEENKKIMFTENRTLDGKPTGMCLSWFKGTHNGHIFYTHAGGGGGFYCELRLYPELHRGSFIIFNRSGFSDERVLNMLDG